MKPFYLKVAAPFRLNNKYADLVDEYYIEYDNEKHTLENLRDFFEADEIQDKQVVLSFIKEIDWFSLTSIFKEYPDKIKVKINATQTEKDVFKLQELKIPFFFDPKVLPADSWLNLDLLINTYKVSDVYPMNDLVYDMRKMRKACHSRGIKVRMVLNRIPNNTYNKNSKIIPYMVPQDRSLFQYLDVVEFVTEDPYDWNLFRVLYKIWFEDEEWLGDLSVLYPDLPYLVNTPCIMTSSVEQRLNCGLDCLKRDIKDRGKCNFCQIFYDLSVSLAEKNLYFIS